MPLSKEKRAAEQKAYREKLGTTIPSVVPKTEEREESSVVPKHCSLKHCVICDPEYYQEYFKKTYGDYDWPNMSDDLKMSNLK